MAARADRDLVFQDYQLLEGLRPVVLLGLREGNALSDTTRSLESRAYGGG
jgi:hypothetical protein